MVDQTNRIPETVAFTHDWYREFLEELSDAGYRFRRFADGVADGADDRDGVNGTVSERDATGSGDADGTVDAAGSSDADEGRKEILLRHDVDLSVEAAVRMARIESELGVGATYCVLLTSPLYNPLDRETRRALHEIESLGHEVALHFSTHEYWASEAPPGGPAIERRVQEQRDVLGTVVSPTRTVSFHRPPEWVLDRDFDGFRNTYAPAAFSDVGYVADSSQRWRDEPPAVEALPDTLQLLTHPGLWGEADEGFDARVERAITEATCRTERKTREEFIAETTT